MPVKLLLVKKNFLSFKYFIFFAFLLAIFLFRPEKVLAQEIVNFLHIDQATITRGYTVKDSEDNFRIGIRPFVFSDDSWVKQIKHGYDEYAIPLGKKLISQVYTYDISMPQPHVLEKPIIVALKYFSENKSQKSLYFFNRIDLKWHALPTNFDLKNFYARAYIHFPYTTLAVFEDDQYSQVINLDSASAMVINVANDEVLYSKNEETNRSIASLTKLMTALVFLDFNLDWNTPYTISDDYSYLKTVGSKLYVRAGEIVTLKNLFYSMLVGSANNAALALADSTGLTQEEFVNRMNQKADYLGMTNTFFVDPSGLGVDNQSTTVDVVKLSKQAFRFMSILQATLAKQYTFTTINTLETHTIKNTNPLVNSDLHLTGAKTGYLDEAGYCLVVKAKNNQGQEVIAVVLGNPSWQDRFDEAEYLVYYGFYKI